MRYLAERLLKDSMPIFIKKGNNTQRGRAKCQRTGPAQTNRSASNHSSTKIRAGKAWCVDEDKPNP
jgi:hypothetical protein